MKNKLIKSIAVITFAFGSLLALTPALVSQPAYAEDSICDETKYPNIPEEVRKANGCGSSATKDDAAKIVINIINVIIGISGLIAVVFVIMGGVQYMTSTGDAAKAKKARETILYAVIGLVIVVLSFAIVNFVINNILVQNASSAEGDPATTSLVSENTIAISEKK